MISADRVLGSPLNEREALTNFREALGVAITAARQIALMRDDPQWVLVATAMEGARESAHRLALAPRSKLIHPWVA